MNLLGECAPQVEVATPAQVYADDLRCKARKDGVPRTWVSKPNMRAAGTLNLRRAAPLLDLAGDIG